MDKFIVRFTVFSSNIWLLYSYAKAWVGEVAWLSAEYFGTSLMSAILLAVLVFSQGKYHCRWAQVLSLNLLFSQSVNILAIYGYCFQDVLIHLAVLSTTWCLSTLLAFYLAIAHFIKVQRLNNKRTHLKLYSDGDIDYRS